MNEWSTLREAAAAGGDTRATTHQGPRLRPRRGYHLLAEPPRRLVGPLIGARRVSARRRPPSRRFQKLSVDSELLMRRVLYKSFSPIARFQHLIASPIN
eukprot:30847-Pelagococcus_subviridis.AAC.6